MSGCGVNASVFWIPLVFTSTLRRRQRAGHCKLARLRGIQHETCRRGIRVRNICVLGPSKRFWRSVSGSVTEVRDRGSGDAVSAAAGAVCATDIRRLQGWSAQWATEPLVASKDAFKDLTCEAFDHKVKLYLVGVPDGCRAASAGVLRKRVMEAGTRLVHISAAIWP